MSLPSKLESEKKKFSRGMTLFGLGPSEESLPGDDGLARGRRGAFSPPVRSALPRCINFGVGPDHPENTWEHLPSVGATCPYPRNWNLKKKNFRGV